MLSKCVEGGVADRFEMLERAVNSLIADQRAQQVMLMGLIAQVAGSVPDWRLRLDKMRSNAERMIATFQFTEDDEANGQLLEEIRRIANGRYDEIFRGLLEVESSQSQ